MCLHGIHYVFCLYSGMHVYRILTFLLLAVLVSCEDYSDEDASLKNEPETWITKKVAVVLPMQNGKGVHWKRTLSQCAADVKEAFQGQEVGIKLEFEWYDEDTQNLEQLSKDLSNREDIAAVIGGKSSEDADIMSRKFSRTYNGKPFFTLATSDEFIRRCADANTNAKYVWAMVESDVHQCELLLLLAQSYGAKSVSLLANDDLYGRSFTNWFGYFATQIGLNVKLIFEYGDNDFKEVVGDAFNSEADFLICVPKSISEIQYINNQYRANHARIKRCLYSDVAAGQDVAEFLGADAETVEGITFGSDPSSGFDIKYETLFGESPLVGESQVYDAAMMIGFASFIEYKYDNLSLNNAIKKLVNGRDRFIYSPTVDGMRNFVSALAVGGAPNLRGYSGEIDFDRYDYTNVIESTYYNYGYQDGKYYVYDYYSESSNGRTSSMEANWNVRNDANKMSDIKDEDVSGISYPSLDERWALLVAAASGWENYRHQADVYYMYQYLRRIGYDDDHIVRISQDDIVKNPKNPLPGYMSVSIGGENVYKNMRIDYNLSEVSPSDLKSILCGEKSDKLQKVISADSDDNILVYWCGHGSSRQYFDWNGESGQERLTNEMVMEAMNSMYQKKCYRKVMCLVEACYSGGVFDVEYIPGVLSITSANATEPSKADCWREENNRWSVYLSNRFNVVLRECIEKNPKMSVREFYANLYKYTTGSHVCLFNADLYGNLYEESIGEFFN